MKWAVSISFASYFEDIVFFKGEKSYGLQIADIGIAVLLANLRHPRSYSAAYLKRASEVQYSLPQINCIMVKRC